jgi:hypothetical protein
VKCFFAVDLFTQEKEAAKAAKAEAYAKKQAEKEAKKKVIKLQSLFFLLAILPA